MLARLNRLLRHPLIIRMLSLGDQVLVSGGNFLLTILLTRYYTEIDLAAYGMAVSVGLILQSVQRNTYIIHIAILDFKVFRGRGRKVIAEQVIAIFPLLAILIMMALAAWHYVPESLWAKTLVATCYAYIAFSQLEFERIIYVKYKKNIIPLISAFVFVAIICALFFVYQDINFYELMLLLTCFAVTKASFLLLIVGMPDFKGGLQLLRRDLKRNSLSSIMSVIGYSAYTHAAVLFLGAMVQPVQAAAFVAMRSLTHPLQIIIRSLDVVDKNLFRAHASKAKKGVISHMNRQIATYFLIGGVLALSIAVFASQIIDLAYAGKYMEFKSTLYMWALTSAVFAVTQPLESALIATRMLNRYNYYRLIIGLITVVVLFVTVPVYGAFGAAAVSMLAGFISFVAGYWAVISAHKVKKWQP